MNEIGSLADTPKITDYSSYREYKDSGVEWLGKVPLHWGVERLKWTVSDCKNGHWGDSPKGDESDLNTVRVADFDRFALRVPDQDFTVRSVPTEKREERVLESGDLLLEKSGGGDKQPVGVVVLYDLDQPAVCSNFIARMPVADGHDPSYLRYLHSALYEAGLNERAIKQSIGIQNLDADFYLNQKVGLPSLDEQRAIADYLDRETERIDALIEKKEQLIDLLEEKRTALISRAVTEGVDRDVEMQDSGVEWLGEIPAGWETGKVAHLFTNLDSERIPVSSSNRADMQGEYPYYGASGVIDHVDDYLFEEPLILVAEDGANLLSRSTPLSFVARGKYWVNNHVHILRPRYEPLEYWAYVLRSIVYDPWITGAAQPKLTQENLDSIELPMPPKKERLRIAERLNEEKSEVNDLIDKVEEGIDRLREYRTALISAAVTGQIDVRKEVQT